MASNSTFPNSRKNDWPWTDDLSSTTYDSHFEWPKISIVTPSYNQGKFIEETIRSVLLQNYPNLEYIIIDGGSSDGTLDIIKKYEPSIDYWISEPDEGQSDAINKGFSQASGQIMGWLNSDDYYAKGALYHLGIAYLDSGKKEGAFLGRGHKVNTRKEVVYSPNPQTVDYSSLLNWMNGNNFMQPACFWTREVWKRCGPIDTRLHYCMDLDFWLKISRAYPFFRVDHDLAYAYMHQDAKTVAEKRRVQAETLVMISQYPQGFEVSREYAFEMADKLTRCNEKFSRLKTYLQIPRIKNLLKKLAHPGS